MKLFRTLFGSAAAAACLLASIWWARHATGVERPAAPLDPVAARYRSMKAAAQRYSGQPLEGADGGASRTVDPSVDPRPALAAEAPFPKALAHERVYEFGRMLIGEQKVHHFRIENQGAGPLVIAKGPTECKCTISNLPTRSVPPGGSVDVEVAWAPRESDPTFEKSAIIWTNDPELPEIRFRVSGKVAQALVVLPKAWHAGLVAEDQEGKAVGSVVSDLEAGFKILSVESPDPNVKVTYKPMSASALDRLAMLGGYEFTVHVGNGIPLGTFRRRLKILTSLEPKALIEVELTATRPGPIRILSAGTAHWSAEKSLLNLGRFRHEDGYRTEVPAYIYHMPGPFRLLGVKSSDGFVKVSVEANPDGDGDKNVKSGERQGVRFVFEVPPGSPPVNYFTQKPVHVTLETNHPVLKTIDFDLQFVSL
jgi:Protein of unknown function (DUF1573)